MWRRTSFIYPFIPQMAKTIKVWIRAKPGAKDSILVYHTGGKGPATWAISSCLSEYINMKLDLVVNRIQSKKT